MLPLAKRSMWIFKFLNIRKMKHRASRVSHQLRICLPVQGTQEAWVQKSPGQYIQTAYTHTHTHTQCCHPLHYNLHHGVHLGTLPSLALADGFAPRQLPCLFPNLVVLIEPGVPTPAAAPSHGSVHQFHLKQSRY